MRRKTWAEGLKANLARKPDGGDRDQVKAIWAGECDIALGNTYYMGEMLADPEQAEWAEFGAHRVSGLRRRRHAHEHLGRGDDQGGPEPRRRRCKLMEWLSSDEAQKIYAETNHEFPVKPGVALLGAGAELGRRSPPDTLSADRDRGPAAGGAEADGRNQLRRLNPCDPDRNGGLRPPVSLVPWTSLPPSAFLLTATEEIRHDDPAQDHHRHRPRPGRRRGHPAGAGQPRGCRGAGHHRRRRQRAAAADPEERADHLRTGRASRTCGSLPAATRRCSASW